MHELKSIKPTRLERKHLLWWLNGKDQFNQKMVNLKDKQEQLATFCWPPADLPADLWFMEWKTSNLLKKRKQPIYSWDDLKKTYIYLISVHIGSVYRVIYWCMEIWSKITKLYQGQIMESIKKRTDLNICYIYLSLYTWGCIQSDL